MQKLHSPFLPLKQNLFLSRLFVALHTNYRLASSVAKYVHMTTFLSMSYEQKNEMCNH